MASKNDMEKQYISEDAYDKIMNDSYVENWETQFNKYTDENAKIDTTASISPYTFANTIQYSTLLNRWRELQAIDKEIETLNRVEKIGKNTQNTEEITEKKEKFDIGGIKLSFNKFMIISFFIFVIIVLVIILIMKKHEKLVI